MADKPGSPAPEVLQPKADKAAENNDTSSTAGSDSNPATPKRRLRRGSYRPSHKATFIGLAVVIVILGANTAIIMFVLKGQNKKIQQAQGNVVISQSALDKVGVNRTPIGTSGIVLTVNPDARFKGNVSVGSSLSVGGQLILNNNFTAGNASLAQLKAGDTSLQQLNVNGDATVSNLNLRKDLVVAGSTRLQGPAILSQLLTVNNSADIAGNLAVGGTLSVASFHTSSLVSDYGMTVGGHIVTEGSSPGIAKGPDLGASDTVSASGNDISGTVAVNISYGGLNCNNGCNLASISFNKNYNNTPHVVVTAVGPVIGGSVYVNRTVGGFTLGVTGTLSAGGHAFDYIVEQ